jgi:hypothetical protein
MLVPGKEMIENDKTANPAMIADRILFLPPSAGEKQKQFYILAGNAIG